MTHRLFSLTLRVAGLLIAPSAFADCAPNALGTERTLTLKKEATGYGNGQAGHLPLARREVVLTFDDGPRPETTPHVLAALATQCVKATFFLVGRNLAQHPDLARHEVSEGHSVGVHSYAHPHFSTMSPQDQLADLDAVEDEHKAVFGTAPAAYRFPFLEETLSLVKALADRKITIMSIDVGVDEFDPAITPERLTDQLIDKLNDSGGGIVLIHDANEKIADTLPRMLSALKENDFKIVHLEWE